ncbi:peptidoglycan-binding protein [Ruegeria sp. R13_0]|nr:peptidoglycan-binding protein [Ruegeria sp. R13_0]
MELGKLFRKVRDSVFNQTKGYQEPFTYGSLPGSDIFLVPAASSVNQSDLIPRLQESEKNQLDKREASAERVLSEALKLEDEKVRLNALDVIARLYPKTQAGLAAKSAVAALTPEIETVENPIVQSDTSVTDKAVSDDRENETASTIAQNSEQKAELDLNLGPNEYRAVQSGLRFLGFSVGPVDGIFGTRSRAALREFQSENGEAQTGYLTEESYAVLKRNAQSETRNSEGQENPNTTSPSSPQVQPHEEAASGYNGEYIIDIRRRPDPLGTDAGSSVTTMLWLQYRKTSNGFQLIRAVDRSLGGDQRSKKYRASLNESGQLRISGKTNYLFNSVIVVPFSISLNLPTDFSRGRSLQTTQGRFDKNYFVDVRITRQ